jgi:sarcosine oxidase subunit gamma
MAEPLIALSALGTPAGAAFKCAGTPGMVELAQLPPGVAVDLRFDPADEAARAAVTNVTGLMLPRDHNTAASAGEYTALWLGPDEWLIHGPARAAGLAERLEGALLGCRASVVDVSDLRAAMRLSGPAARDVLAKGCAVDLHPRVFVPGMTAVTQFARLRALIHCLDAESAFDVYVERSVADYAWLWLDDAMREFTA